jgi:hypothetical protein
VQPLSFKKGDSVCNLCLGRHNLTDDHIPPQCCGNDKAIVARRIYAEELVARQVDARSNNGLKWRTLCRPCNGDIVGRWDPALGEFTKQLEAIVSPTLVLPQVVSFSIRGGAVLRSVLGHVLAAKTKSDAVPADSKIREFLRGLGPLHPNVEVYCWLYPYRPIVVARDFTWVELEGGGSASPGLATVIKFFPLAFLIVDANGKGSVDSRFMTALHSYATLDEKSVIDVSVCRSPIIAPGWPERTMGNHVVLGGQTYIDAVTTVTPDVLPVAPEREVQAEPWPEGDASCLLNDLHAFVNVPKT